ncbi:hypothetical protein MSG28_000841 [Choristoneura fumiferana]|uniref:Uncharacterized protein n=1 Tax=Choristoneura fumiferana TaxID=7141 RepID=A0ACC0K395_CHOFU|nr:hypothetical protein MSG28_000841 [Choristoneura fumiferana]
MKYNYLGNTGLKVSHVSLGGASFSNIYGLQDKEKSVELIRETLKLGVNYMETSPWYGQGSSEISYGKALKGIPRESYFIGSKVGRYEKNVQHMFDFSAEKTEAAVDMTLERLGLEYVDLIQSKGVGVINAAATGMGLLTNNGPQPWHPASDHIKSFCKQASDYCKALKGIPRESYFIGSKVGRYEKNVQRMFDFSAEKTEAAVDMTLERLGLDLNPAATGMGLLTNNGPQPWHPASDHIKSFCKQASDYCKVSNSYLGTYVTHKE